MEQKELAERCVEYLERFQDLFPLEFRGQVFNLRVFWPLPVSWRWGSPSSSAAPTHPPFLEAVDANPFPFWQNSLGKHRPFQLPYQTFCLVPMSWYTEGFVRLGFSLGL